MSSTSLKLPSNMAKDWNIIKTVANYIKNHPGQTGAEISLAVGNAGAYRRLSEIRKLGLAQKGQLRSCTISKKLAWTWYPADNVPEPNRGIAPRDEIKRLKARNEFLEAKVRDLENVIASHLKVSPEVMEEMRTVNLGSR